MPAIYLPSSHGNWGHRSRPSLTICMAILSEIGQIVVDPSLRYHYFEPIVRSPYHRDLDTHTNRIDLIIVHILI